MFRAVILVALLSAAAVPPRTASAAEAPEPDAPTVIAPVAGAPALAAPALAAPAAAPAPPGPEIGLGAFQLAAGYTAEIGGIAGLAALGVFPKDIGWNSGYATVGFIAAIAPGLAGGAVCGIGSASRSYRGRCATTLLGAYVGAALGTLLGMALAPSPGPDDTAEFERTIAAIGGIALLTPIGAMIGYHAGKREIPRDGATAAASAPFDDGQVLATPAVEPRRGAFTEPPARRLLLSIVNVSW